jgi:hypothetical protein
MNKKQPPIFEETDTYIEVEISEGTEEEYDLEGFFKSGNGESYDKETQEKKFYEYYTKDKK